MNLLHLFQRFSLGISAQPEVILDMNAGYTSKEAVIVVGE